MPTLEKYAKTFEMGFQNALEYRMNFLLSLISAAFPVFIQSYLWSAIYRNSSESVLYGYTFRQMMVYTFLSGLIGRIVRTGFEYDIMNDIKNGKFSKFLVQPVGYFPYQLSAFLGQKLPGLVMILGILVIVLVGLVAFLDVSLEFARILAFIATLFFAVVLNFIIFYCFSSLAFWVVEIGFLFEGIRIVTILLSGGIFPLEVFGERALWWLNLLPFKYTVSYPINVLNGRLPLEELARGMLLQGFWIVMTFMLAKWLWNEGSRRYVAVGG